MSASRCPIATNSLLPVATLLRELADRMDRAETSAHQAGLAEHRQADEDEARGQALLLLEQLEAARIVDEAVYTARLAALRDGAEPYAPELLDAEGLPLCCTDDPDQPWDDAMRRYQDRQAAEARRELPGDVDPMAVAMAMQASSTRREQLH